MPFMIVPSTSRSGFDLFTLRDESNPHYNDSSDPDYQTDEGFAPYGSFPFPPSIPRADRSFTASASAPATSEELALEVAREEEARALRAEVERINKIPVNERPMKALPSRAQGKQSKSSINTGGS